MYYKNIGNFPIPRTFPFAPDIYNKKIRLQSRGALFGDSYTYDTSC